MKLPACGEDSNHFAAHMHHGMHAAAADTIHGLFFLPSSVGRMTGNPESQLRNLLTTRGVVVALGEDVAAAFSNYLAPRLAAEAARAAQSPLIGTDEEARHAASCLSVAAAAAATPDVFRQRPAGLLGGPDAGVQRPVK